MATALIGVAPAAQVAADELLAANAFRGAAATACAAAATGGAVASAATQVCSTDPDVAEATEAATAKVVTRFLDGVEVRARGQTMQVMVDLGPTLDRIESGGTFPYRNDGSIFMNREGLLPQQGLDYYQEFVHPTPGISGPGPQRIILGQGARSSTCPTTTALSSR